MPTVPRPASERFWAKVNKTDSCWLWTASLHAHGYGKIRLVGGKWVRAHRFAYEELVGPVPEGMHLDHKCHNTACVRPDHLQVVTPVENAQNRRGAQERSGTGVRGVRKRRGKYEVRVCANGRRYSGGYHATLAEAEAVAVELRNQVMTNNLADRPTPW